MPKREILLIQTENESYLIDKAVVDYIRAAAGINPLDENSLGDFLAEVNNEEHAVYFSVETEDKGSHLQIKITPRSSPLEESVQNHLYESYQMLQERRNYQRRDPFRADLAIDTPDGTYTLDDLEGLEIHNFPRLNRLEE